MSLVLWPAIAFLVGSIPMGYLLARLRGVDIRKLGSGNIGATNVMRQQGKRLGLLTLLLDILKGVLPTFAAAHFAGGRVGAATGLLAVVGHCYSIFLKGKGGKGVATGLGVFLALAPLAVLAGLAVFLIVIAIQRTVSLGSISAALSLPIASWLLHYPPETVSAALLAGGIIVLRHKDNIKRIRAGTESRLGGKGSTS